jgi:hypothetical protein
MWKYQKPLPLAKPGEKWLRMNMIFKLTPGADEPIAGEPGRN